MYAINYYAAVKILLLTVFSFLVCLSLQAQGTQPVKGKVTGDNDDPLPGVSVVVKGTTNGTVTDAGGNYALSVPEANSILVFSFVGYTTEEVPVNNRSQINTSLVPDIKSLSEIVVVGYGTQRKAETTGAIASVKSAEITQTPVANVAQGLQARVSGVQVTQNSAAPGGNVSVRIRGTNSINGTSEPLYIVDGVQISNGGGVNEVSPLSTINPNDIESVEVLKDASSTAIYGARGANGVVLITTKRGTSGATRVAYEGYYGVQQVNKKIDMLNAAEFAALENEVYKTNIYDDPASLGEGVNWQDIVFRDAPIQNHQLSVIGGSEKTQLALSANYFDQDGVVINNNFKRYSLRANIDHRISDRFKVGTSILGSYSINKAIPTGSTSLDGPVVTSSIVGAAIAAPPTLQPYDANGNVLPFADQMNGRYREVVNPLGLAAIMNRTNIKRVLANVYGEVNIVKGLTYRASFNVISQNDLNDYYSPVYIVATRDRNATSGNAAKMDRDASTLLHESILTYSKSFAERHSLKFTGVFSTQSNEFKSNTTNTNGFPNDATLNEALQLGTTTTVTSNRTKERLDSYMGRINYGFRDKYFVDLTARADGVSKFGSNFKYGFFPAIAAAWRVSEEGFMQNLPFISDLKIRASYGLTGNAGAINPYRSLATVSAGPSNSVTSYVFNHIYTIGLSPSDISNPDLRWEKSVQTDVGIDLSLFNNRASLTVDAYHKKTRDLLYVKRLPLTSGYNTLTGNFAELENKGIEFAANAILMDKAVKWNVSANITFNRNKVLSLDEGVTTETFVTPYTVLRVGEPLGVFKTLVFDGIYQTDESTAGRPGSTKVKEGGQVITGDPNPDFIFGFSTNLAYKNFDLNAFFSGTYGNDIYNVSRYTLENPLGNRNVMQGLANRWSPTNPSNEYVAGFQGGRLPISDRFVEDGSYLRCKNSPLGYTLPLVKGIHKIRVYVSANNLFTVTNYTGFDPEVNSYGGSNTAMGMDTRVYPVAKSYLGGLQLTF